MKTLLVGTSYASKYNAAFRKAQDLIDDNMELEPVISGVNIPKLKNGSIPDRSILLFLNPDSWRNMKIWNYASKYNPEFRKAQNLIDDNTELEPVIQR